MNKKHTLSDKISKILNTTPASFNPDEEDDETSARVTEGAFEEDEEDNVLISKFRARKAELLEDIDQKYAGRKGSRKNFQHSDEESDAEGESNEEDASDDGEEESCDQDEESGESSEGEEINGDDEDTTSIDKSNFQHMYEADVPSKISKSVCVRNQLNIWETLIEMRIQMQKCLLTANKMPQKDHYADICKVSGEKFTKQVDETKKSVCTVLDKLLELQDLVWKEYPETKNILRSGSKAKLNVESNEEILSDTEPEGSEEEEEDAEIPKKRMRLEDYENDINDRHNKYQVYRNSVIQKWNDKTTLPSKGNTLSVLNQIEHILIDRTKLVKRTQTKRSNYEILGVQETEQPTDDQNVSELPEQPCNAEIFDDDDFYHHLLRELIEVKSADVSDPVQLSRQWIQLQNLRSKMKRKIDTRATKGRKIRYTTHAKLVNFMAPIDKGLYTEDAKNELFSSLFGRNQPVHKA